MSETVENLSAAKRALYEIRTLKAKLSELERAQKEPIAIVGLGLRFPGDVSTPNSFWDLLSARVHVVIEVPPSRWPVERFYDPDADAPAKMYARHGAFLSDPALFDADFFGISPREAVSLDPQHRLALEVAWETLENAGYSPAGLANTATGVFLAASNSDYGRMVFARTAEIDAYSGIGNIFSVMAGRISYFLGLHGPSLVVDTACSGSLVSIHLACQSLRARECHLALAGGVNLILTPELHINFSKSRMMSPDGKCKAFDAAADGYVRGEGCGLIALKRLSDALSDGDQILALIHSSAVNQDGHSSGVTAPNGVAQEALLRQALASSSFGPEDVDYIEAHGTGTSLGDPIEARAIAAVFGSGHTAARPLLVGSVKTNIGHLEAAAGVAGLIKVVLSLQHEQIPPNLHFRTLNPHITWGDAFQVPAEAHPWRRGSKARIAGISSFGFSGTNAHVLIGEAPAPAARERKFERPLHILALSARSASALEQQQMRFAEALTRSKDELGDICFTANSGRTQFAHRAVYAGDTRQNILTSPLAQGVAETRPEVVFLFPGLGAQFSGMGQELYQTQPIFRKVLDQSAKILQSEFGQSLFDLLWGSAAQLLGQAAFAAPALFAIEFAFSELWRSWGIVPAAITGYGTGQYAAACAAGVYSFSDALQLVARHARLILEFAGSPNGSFELAATRMTPQPPQIRLLSSVTGASLDLHELSNPAHWLDQTKQPVPVGKIIEALSSYGHFLEVGPGMEVAGPDNGVFWATSLRKGRSEWAQMLESLGRLFARGADVNWTAFDEPYNRRRVPLPTYPFERRRYWLSPMPEATPAQAEPEAQWHSTIEAARKQAAQGPLDLQLSSYPARWAALDALAAAYIVKAVCKMGMFRAAGETYSVESAARQFEIASLYHRLFERWLDKLVDEKLLTRDGTSYTATQPLAPPALEILIRQANEAFNGSRILPDYVNRAGEHLADVITGKFGALETLFPGGSFAFAEDLYEHDPVSMYFNSIAGAALNGFLKARPGFLQVLEIGAGTGSTTSSLLETLPSDRATFHFTDVSDIFLNHAERKFARYPFVRYGRLDIERDVAPQGYVPGAFDVITATNVLHATRDIRSTVANVRSLLAPGGILILYETTEYFTWLDTTVALIAGWQRFEDGLRGDHPLLSANVWTSVLEQSGFECVVPLPDENSAAAALGRRVLIAQAPGASREQVKPMAVPTAQLAPKRAECDAELAAILSAPRAQAHEKVLEIVRANIARMLRLDSPSRVGLKRRLTEMGIDSLMAVELRNRLGKVFQAAKQLPSTLVFDFPTVEDLAAYIERDVLHLEDQPAVGTENDAVAKRAQELEGLQEEAVEALLLEKLQSL